MKKQCLLKLLRFPCKPRLHSLRLQRCVTLVLCLVLALLPMAALSMCSHQASAESAEPEKPQEQKPEATNVAPSTPGGAEGEITDPAFLNDILASLPGVDPNDPQIQQILEAMKGQAAQPSEKKEGDK